MITLVYTRHCWIMRIKVLIYTLFIRIKWKFDVFHLRKLIDANNEIQRSIQDENYLVLMPHADDELIGCSQLLKRTKGGVVVNMDMPGGDDDRLHHLRYNEFVNYMNSIDKEYLNIDTEKESALTRILLDRRPSYIFAPSFVDWHSEHHEVIRLLVSAISKTINEHWNPRIAMYQVSIPIHYKSVNLAYPMLRKQQKEKWDNFKQYYVTQTHLPSCRFSANEKINGKLVNSYAAECFWVLKADEWIHFIKDHCNPGKYKNLSSCINNLPEIHKQVGKLYESFIRR